MNPVHPHIIRGSVDNIQHTVVCVLSILCSCGLWTVSYVQVTLYTVSVRSPLKRGFVTVLVD